MGIFSPGASISYSVTGFSGLGAVGAICTPTGVLVLSVGNSVGYPISIIQINSSFFSKTHTSVESNLIQPDSISKIFVLNGCPNSSSTKFSLSVSVKYTEPTQVLKGPFISTGAITGTTSPFVQNTVAYYNNLSYVNILHSTSFNKIWNAGKAYTLILWVNLSSTLPSKGLVWEQPGCNSGSFTGMAAGEWSGGADQCTSTSAISSYNNVIYYNKWSMVTDIFYWNGSGGWMAICTNLQCANNTYSASQLPGGPANYSTPNVYSTYIGSTGIIGEFANTQVYDFAFSATQIATEYNLGYGGVPITSTGLIAWYPLDGNTNDYSGNSNNGVATNVQWVSS